MTAHPIRLAFICDNLELGGQELGFLELLRRLDRKKFVPHLYAFRPGSLLTEIQALRISMFVAHDKPGIDPTWDERDERAKLHYRTQLSDLVERDRIEVGLVFAWPDAIPACANSRLALVERVDGSTLSAKIRDKSAFASIICESKTVRRWLLAQRKLLNCKPSQLVVIPNGVDLQSFEPSMYDRSESRQSLAISDDEFVIGAIARLAPQKNLGYLLRAFRMFTDRATNVGRKVRLVIAGPDFGSLTELQSAAGELGINQSVSFLPARRDVARTLRAFDAYALTSLSEGTPFTVLEAMAMALPIIATPVGSLPEILDNNGFLVDLIQPEDAARAMFELLAKPELRAKLAKRSRQLALKYDYGRMLQGYEHVLEQAYLKRDIRSPGGVAALQ